MLANDGPPVDSVGDMIETSPHSVAALLSAWHTGKIAHRRAAIGEMRWRVTADHRLPAELESMVLAAALDPDQEVRADAFRVLRRCQHPALASLIAAQLRDCDPEARLMGLEYLKWMNAGVGVPLAVPILGDTDPLVAANAVWLLGELTHQDFGLRLTEIAPGAYGEKSGLRDLHENARTNVQAAVERARAWWATNRTGFVSAPGSAPAAASPELAPEPVTDFKAPALDGHKVHLADLRGKEVLLYFWTSTCPGGVSGLQDLVTLQQKAGGRLAVVAVSLDIVHDDDGDLGGEDDGKHHDHTRDEETSPAKLQQKVVRLTRELGVNFPVILDHNFFVGGRFNAVDLPATVIVDSQGFVRRCFAGRRTPPVLEMMLAEAGQPVTASR